MKRYTFNYILIAIIAIISTVNTINLSAAQLKGTIYGYDVSQKQTPLIGATVMWENTKMGTISGKNGKFSLEKTNKSNVLVISYASYSTIKLEVKNGQDNIEIQLEPSTSDAVTVYGKQEALMLSKSAINTTEISITGLRKAACCNLSESFVANPSVDVNFTDAVTGAKQIELLGLQGIYTQMMTENIPNLRGLSTTYGLNYVPGQWMESIQISKGAASVTAGFESITGQINVEYKKPKNPQPIFLNIFGSNHGMFEADVIGQLKLTENLSTNAFFHYNYFGRELDHNKDSFIDHPLEKQYSFMNKWEYENNGLHTSHTIKVLNEDRQAGQMGYFSENKKDLYGIDIKTERYELFGKLGYVLPTKSYNSIASMYSVSTHNQNSFYGKKTYKGNQKSFFAKVLYETKFGRNKEESCCSEESEEDDHAEAEEEHEEKSCCSGKGGEEHADDDGHEHEATEAEETHEEADMHAEEYKHKVNLGASFNFDEYKEQYTNSLANATNLLDTNMNKIERVPGLFLEYTYFGIKNVTMIAGARVDFHNLYNTLFTPRLHVKYQPYEEVTIRGSVGKGYHLPNVFAENAGLFISSRDVYFDETLKPEEAWNMGLNATFIFHLFDNKFTMNTDYYHTNFVNQVIVDLERNSGQVHFYNLDGKSYSNAYQVDLSFSPIEHIDLMAAYRYNDVKCTINGELVEKPLASRFKTYLNLAYTSPRGTVKFDITGVVNGGGRLPNTEKNPEQYRLDKEFKPFFTLQSQITIKIKDLEVYFGGDNLTNFHIHHPIISADNPFGEYFDGSMVWGPVLGRKLYAGIRFSF